MPVIWWARSCHTLRTLANRSYSLLTRCCWFFLEKPINNLKRSKWLSSSGSSKEPIIPRLGCKPVTSNAHYHSTNASASTHQRIKYFWFSCWKHCDSCISFTETTYTLPGDQPHRQIRLYTRWFFVHKPMSPPKTGFINVERGSTLFTNKTTTHRCERWVCKEYKFHWETHITYWYGMRKSL